MRFNKHPRFEFTDTHQKRAAIRRRHKREVTKYPLLDFIGEIPPVDEDREMDARRRKHAADDVHDRRRHAADWRKARRLLREHDEKDGILWYWQTYSLTANPVMLLDLIHNWPQMKASRLEAEQRMNAFRRERGDADLPAYKSLTVFLDTLALSSINKWHEPIQQ